MMQLPSKVKPHQQCCHHTVIGFPALAEFAVLAEYMRTRKRGLHTASFCCVMPPLGKQQTSQDEASNHSFLLYLK